MNKNILAVAIAAAVAAPSAFAAATVYGNAHMSINSINSIAGNGKSTDLTSMSSNSSYVGVKGSEDLAGGLKGLYQMEFGVAMDGNKADGSDNKSVGIDSQRNTFVGLGGGFGTVLMGRHDSLIKMTGRKYDLFGDQLGNNRNIMHMSLGQTVSSVTDSGVRVDMTKNNVDAISTFANDGRHNNVLAYISPTWSGFHFGVAYVPSDATTQTEDYGNVKKTHAAFTALADYTAGNFGVTLGYIGIEGAGDAIKYSATGTDLATGVTKTITDQALGGDYRAYRLGGSYTMGAAKIVGLYQRAELGSIDQNTYGLGGSYDLGMGAIKAQYYVAEATGSSAKDGGTMATVGYDHKLSKTTTAYAVYAHATNEDNAAYTTSMGNAGSGSNVTAIMGKDNGAFSVGLQHKF